MMASSDRLIDERMDEGIIPDVKEAVVVRDVSKSYGTWSSKHSIHALQNVNLTVPKGYMYVFDQCFALLIVNCSQSMSEICLSNNSGMI